MGLHLLLIVLDLSGLADDDFGLATNYADTGVVATDEGLHLIFYAALSLGIR